MSLAPDLAPMMGARFLSGFVIAGIVLLVGRLLSGVRILDSSTTLAAGIGVLVAAEHWFPVPIGLAAAVFLFGAAGRLAHGFGYRLVMLAPGVCLLFTSAGLPGPLWARGLLCAGSWVTAAAAPDIDRVSTQVGPLLIAVSATALYFTVPDTERALVVLGGAIALALVGPFLSNQRVGHGGVAVMSALMAWAACFGATGRPTSALGATVGFGVLLVAPLVARLRRMTWRVGPVRFGLSGGLFSVQLIIDAFAVRVIGRAPTPALATILTSILVVGLAGLYIAVDRRASVLE